MSARLSRRRFLRGLGGTVVALPLFTSRRGRAQEGTFPLRFVVVQQPNGVIPSAWFPLPGTSVTDFVLGENHAPLALHRERMVILEGIGMPALSAGPGEPHQKGMGGVLTGRALLSPSEENGSFVGGDGSLAGWGSGISLDQRIAQHIGTTTPLASLQLGVRATTAEVRSRISYLGPALPLPPVIDPVATFELLFSDAHTAPDVLAVQRAERRSVLDTALSQFARVASQVSAEDRAKLAQHEAMVRDLEARLAAGTTIAPGCAPLIAPQSIETDSEDTMPDVAALQIDLLAAAFACDVTRVATLQFSNAQNHIRFPWLDMSPDDPDVFTASLGDGHSLSHAGPSAVALQAEHAARTTWYASQVARLLDKLDAIPEGDGTVLDHTLVLWVNEIAVGNTHSQDNMPFVLMGGLGGRLVGGRFLSYPSTGHGDLLTAILAAFGVDELFGDPEFTTGPLTGLFT